MLKFLVAFLQSLSGNSLLRSVQKRMNNKVVKFPARAACFPTDAFGFLEHDNQDIVNKARW